MFKKYKDKFYNYGPYLILFLVMVYVHMRINVNFGDDLAFARVLDNKTLIEFLKGRYVGWSSRIFIEAVMVSVLQVDVIIWKILDILIIMLTAYSLMKIFNYRNEKIYNWVIIGFILIYPFSEMSSAGWVATTCNYLWPLAIGLFSIVLIVEVFNNKKISKIKLFIYMIATIYACNVEQMAIILLPTYLLASSIYYFRNKKINKFILTQCVISIISLLFIVLSPGNTVRKGIEIINWYPSFQGYDLFDKLTLGITSTAAEIILGDNCLFGLMLIFLSVAIYLKRRDIFYTIISIVPILIYAFMKLSLIIDNSFFKEIKSKYYKYTLNVYDFKNVDSFNYNDITSYIPIILSIIMLGIIIILVYILFGNDFKALLAIYIWCIGVLSRIAIGFSPTIYASNTRTYIFLHFAIISILILTIKEIGYDINSKKFKILSYIILIFGVLYSLTIF